MVLALACLVDAGDKIPREVRERVEPEPELEVTRANRLPVRDELILLVEGGAEGEADVDPESDINGVRYAIDDHPRRAVQAREECDAHRQPEGRVVQKVFEQLLEAGVPHTVLVRWDEAVVAPQTSFDDSLLALGLQPRQGARVAPIIHAASLRRQMAPLRSFVFFGLWCLRLAAQTEDGSGRALQDAVRGAQPRLGHRHTDGESSAVLLRIDFGEGVRSLPQVRLRKLKFCAMRAFLYELAPGEKRHAGIRTCSR